MKIADYCADFPAILIATPEEAPWEVVDQLGDRITQIIGSLGTGYAVRDGVAYHETSNVDPTAQVQAPAIIGPHCFVGPHSLLRGGVYMGASSTIGFSCEVKSTVVCSNAAIAHLNYIGDSIVGSGVDLEAGAQVVNYYNERNEKRVSVFVDSEKINTGVTKFGALIGDDTKIGANAVLAPGTVLGKGSIVRRLELIDQAARE